MIDSILVNDGSIELSKLFNEKLIFFGERHGSKSDINFVRKMISSLEPDFVLVEGLGDLILKTKSSKTKATKLYTESLFHGRLTRWWIDVSLEYDIPFIGIELTDRSKIKNEDDLVETFKAREEHWIKVIKQYASSNKLVLVICGDTHLRTVSCKALGEASPFYKTFPQATFIRLENPEIE